MVTYLMSWINLMDCPGIVRERFYKSEFSGGDKPEEPAKEHLAQRLIAVFLIFPIPISGYEGAGRVVMGQSDLPMMTYATGSLLVFSSVMLISWVLRVNKYASKVVYKQQEHQLVTHGPYALVRHPFYSFMISLLVGWPLLMGFSGWAMFLSLLSIPVLMWRTYHEEEFLLKEFGDSYKRYQKDVPYRMIPWMF